MAVGTIWRRMIERAGRSRSARAWLALGGLMVAAGLAWRTLSGHDLALLADSWVVPAVALLHFVEQAGCGCAWHRVVEPPRPSRWTFIRARWIRASVAALAPVSGVGAALVAVRLLTQAGIRVDMASASLTLDATMEMSAQVVFTMLGIGLIFAAAPRPRMLGPIIAGLALAVLMVAVFIAAQRAGAFKLIDFGLSRSATRWPRLSHLREARFHEQLMRLHRQRWSTFVSGSFHLGSWLLGAGEIWLVLVALGQPANLVNCVIIESLGMAARSAGFFVPGALGVQEVALVAVGNLVGLSPETAVLIAIVKRLRDVAVGVPGLLVWQWAEGGRVQIRRRVSDTTVAPEPEVPGPIE